MSRVALGETYRSAAAQTRAFARRMSDVSKYYPRQRRMRYGDSDGQLVSNWVDVFTEVLMEGKRPAAWPEKLMVDSVGFRCNGNPPGAFHVFVLLSATTSGARSGSG